MSLVRRELRDDVSILTLDRPRANAFNPELVADLRAALRETSSARAVVIGSTQKIFSGGWDLPTLVGLDRAGMTAFLEAYCALVREVFTSPVPVIAALNGHAIAGGLILAAAADERIAGRPLETGKGELLVGLSEVALGVPLPRPLFEIFRFVLGSRGAERLAAAAENLPLDRAVAAGLVDAAVPSDELADKAFERARLLGGSLATATAEVRRRAREGALSRFDAARHDDPFLDFWFAEPARERIEALVARLTKK